MYKNCCGKVKVDKVVKEIGQGNPDPADDPNFSIEEIAQVANANIDGDLMTMLIPHNEWEDYMDFDRNAAKLGFEDFIRPSMKSDTWPKKNPETGEVYDKPTHIIVQGTESFRTRLPLYLNFEKRE